MINRYRSFCYIDDDMIATNRGQRLLLFFSVWRISHLFVGEINHFIWPSKKIFLLSSTFFFACANHCMIIVVVMMIILMANIVCVIEKLSKKIFFFRISNCEKDGRWKILHPIEFFFSIYFRWNSKIFKIIITFDLKITDKQTNQVKRCCCCCRKSLSPSSLNVYNIWNVKSNTTFLYFVYLYDKFSMFFAVCLFVCCLFPTIWQYHHHHHHDDR